MPTPSRSEDEEDAIAFTGGRLTLADDPDKILRTGPIEQVDRPALRKATPDPISERLDNPQLSQTWAPHEWSAPSVSLDVPEIPAFSSQTVLEGGWKPRDWKPPEYANSTSQGGKPAHSSSSTLASTDEQDAASDQA